ncbi:MAG: hypothetical protein AMS27_00075 [Bacteroides sp. SM23_62_1]|nr:MAG: hypothetical protein AMS27_00075 [Bacteroides sp. SM23_62_1]
MNRYRLYNNILGWIVFLVAAFVYLSTIEPTASFWDCGEFIAASFKLEVGHPPGAPFFLLLGRFFSLFAGSDVGKVAKMINILSALASAFTILFLFWTITHLARKIVLQGNEMTLKGMINIFSCGIVGALAYTFSDTFWFSAVEGEVYATSSLFTAIVFWAILKWENIADEKHANKWIILIAFLMGLSIGVHLLNLLAIPAIVFVYYFRKYEVTRKGIIYSLAISVLLLAIMLYIIIPGIVKLASGFELVFVNGFGLPYQSGVIVFIIALFVGFVYLVIWTHRQQRIVLNTITLALAMIVIGYFSYGTVLIRSAADPPMDQNNPENVFSLLSYLNREQYGSSPLYHGQYYNAPIVEVNPGKKVYTMKDGKYVVTYQRPKVEYDNRFITIFPRMWSTDTEHVEAYQKWGKIKGIPVNVINRNGDSEMRRKPTFGENLRFFFRYQVGHMYLRYFMWNFAGRQNDLQGHGEFFKGNWLSGIRFIDESRLGPQDHLPAFMNDNKARNEYYMLPLLLGIIGLVFHFLRNRKDFWVITLLFLMTGLAIVVYLNQYPFQPRERDYAYAASFYAFTIWIGLGVLAIADTIQKKIPGIIPGLLTFTLTLVVVPGIMAKENRDDHDRSGRYTARDFAWNYLNSCEPNAILFTNGDNDTFPLWYIQEVEGVRTDIRVCNLSYLGADWYIDQMARKAYDSDALPFGMGHDQYIMGKRDMVYLVDRISGPVRLKDAMDFVRSEDSRTKTLGNIRDRIDYIPAKKFVIEIDTARIFETNTLSRSKADRIDNMVWELNTEEIYKNGLMVYDLLDNNNWERPIYYAVTVARDLYLNLHNYFQLEGLAYRIVPVYQPSVQGQLGRLDTDLMYNNFINKFRWGGVTDSTVYLDENNLRMLANMRNNFGRLAQVLINEGKKDSAKVVLDRCMEILPHSRVPFDYFMLPVIENYYRIGDTETAGDFVVQLSDVMTEEARFFLLTDRRLMVDLDYEKQIRMHILQELVRLPEQYGQEELKNRQLDIFEEFVNLYSLGG